MYETSLWSTGDRTLLIGTMSWRRILPRKKKRHQDFELGDDDDIYTSDRNLNLLVKVA